MKTPKYNPDEGHEKFPEDNEDQFLTAEMLEHRLREPNMDEKKQELDIDGWPKRPPHECDDCKPHSTPWMGPDHYGHDPALCTTCLRVFNNYEILLNALKEIMEGKGRYSQDNFEHCRNTVEDKKERAAQAIAKVEGKE